MFDCVKNVVGYYFPTNKIMNSDESSTFLQNHVDETVNEEPGKDGEASTTLIRTGKITHLNDLFGIVDNKHTFEKYIYGSKLTMGMDVSYVVSVWKGAEKLQKILVAQIQDSYETSDVGTVNEKLIPCQVEGRDGRKIILNAEWSFDLDQVKSDFVPQQGDWITVTCTVEVNATDVKVLQVSAITPMCRLWEKRRVTEWDGEEGILARDTYFDITVVTPGYLPILNDEVIVNVIESTREKFTWRALRVYPYVTFANNKSLRKTVEEQELLWANKNGIEITNNLLVSMSVVGDQALLTVEVTNVGSMPQVFIGLKQEATKQQLFLQSPEIDKELTIIPQQTILFNFLCTALLMGKTQEPLHFSFTGFSIERWVWINVCPSQCFLACRRDFHNRQYKKYARAARESYSKKDQVTGQRPARTPAFVERRLPEYYIPGKIVNEYLHQIEKCSSLRSITLNVVTKEFTEQLTVTNYAERFHNLLYIEELSYVVNLHKYDTERVTFTKQNQFLLLEVENLRERRPCLSIGDKVYVIPVTGGIKKWTDSHKLEGYIHKVLGNFLHIKFNEAFHNEYAGEECSVQFTIARTNFRRYHLAIDDVYKKLGEAFLFPNAIKLKQPQVIVKLDDQTKEQERQLEEERLKEQTNKNITPDEQSLPSPKYAKLVRSWHLRKSPQNSNKNYVHAENYSNTNFVRKIEIKWFNNKLNYYQKQAVVNVLHGVTRPLPYLIFGPPGTGKTITLVETILQTLTNLPNSRILIAAPSNSAVDLLALRLIDSGVITPKDMVRMVAYRCVMDGSIPEKLKPYCASGDLAKEGTRAMQMELLNGVRIDMPKSIMCQHRIIVGTCMSVGILYSMGIKFNHFTHVVVDEAGQCTEPEIMIPFSLVTAANTQIIMAGDPMQLGPCVLCYLCKEQGLNDSFLQRLMDRFPYQRDVVGFPQWGGYDPRLVTKLIYNYRSLPKILHLSNKLFYNSELKTVICPTTSEEAKLLRSISSLLPETQNETDTPPPLIFHGVRGDNYQTRDCPSWFNPCEVQQIFFYIKGFYEKGLSAKDIGVISPYAKQCHAIRELLLQKGLETPKIGSVEDFQGQEYKIVLLSTVRSSEHAADLDAQYGLGFVSSPRRLNVAITRAQALLIIVGNPYLLSLDSYWRSVLRYAISIGGYTGCWLPPGSF